MKKLKVILSKTIPNDISNLYEEQEKIIFFNPEMCWNVIDFDYSEDYFAYYVGLLNSKIKELISLDGVQTLMILGMNIHPMIETLTRNIIQNYDADLEIHVSNVNLLKKEVKLFKKENKEIYNKWWKQFERRMLPLEIFNDGGNQKAIICDLDGTLAFAVEHGLHDYSNFEISKPILNLIKMYSENDYHLFFITSRNEKNHIQTYEWIKNKTNIFNDRFTILMRSKDDLRNDVQVKEDLFLKIPKNYSIDFVLEDKNNVVEMWRDKGLCVLQPTEGNY